MLKEYKDTPHNRHILEHWGIGVAWNIRAGKTCTLLKPSLGFISPTCDDLVTQQHVDYGGIFHTQAGEPLLTYMGSCDSSNILRVKLFACLRVLRITKESDFNTLHIALDLGGSWHYYQEISNPMESYD